MCAIAGLLSTTAHRSPDRNVLAAMCRRLRHRGPDGEGHYVDGPVALGSRRLAIIDLSERASQPMTNETGDVTVVFNGAIYNFRELRTWLRARGHHFRSETDTEVLVHLYEEHGIDLLEHLRGMFALAIWDRARQQLLLARDRFGAKPLYWRVDAQGLAFASEIPALLTAGAPLEPDRAGLEAYLALQYTPAPLTMVRGIRKLAAGYRLIARCGSEPRVERYYRLRFDQQDPRPLAELTSDLRGRFRTAVRRRLVADVPAGVFLSGGLDSAAVALAAAEQASSLPTFTIGFSKADPSLACARLVADRMGARHHELIVEPAFATILPRIVQHLGEPLGDPSLVPTWCLAEFARTQVTVALSGDAADEAFAGYHEYRVMQATRWLRTLPGPAASACAKAMATWCPARFPQVRAVARRALLPEAAEYLGLMGLFVDGDRAAIFGPALRDLVTSTAVLDNFQRTLDDATAGDAAGRLSELDIATYLPDDILMKVDLASMAHGLEVRSPFLDQEMMELAASIPSRHKLYALQGKRILRTALADLVPREILARTKRGFDPPADAWIRGPLADMTRDLLLDQTARQRGWFMPREVDRLVREHVAGASHGRRLWTLLVLELWCRTYLDHPPTPSMHSQPMAPATIGG
jgi:asparagine synthase (glutamine-hydrolysing)